ncbi:MAG: TatD family hydrolase [Candidatus Woesearchaeota archaeon]
MIIVDVHAHIDAFKEEEFERVISNSVNAGVKAIINNGIDKETNRKTLEISKEYKIVKPALGLHPEFIEKFDKKFIDEEIDFIRKQKNKIIAIGEVGLDYHWVKDYSLREKQREMFKEFLLLAKELKKPVIVHSRNAEVDAIKIINKFNLKKVVMHCFGGSLKLVNEIIKNKWYISIPPIILRSTHFQDIVKIVPLSNILTETDSPWLSPYKNKKNEPAFILETIKKISEIKGLTKEEVSNNIFLNYQRIFLED